MNFRGGVEFRKITANSYKSNKWHSHCEKSLRDTKKWKVDSNSTRKNQVCSPIKPLAAEKYYNFASLCYIICITCIMYQQLWGHRFEEKLYLGVREQNRLNTTALVNSLKQRGNYIYQVHYQSVMLNFVFVCFV
jgi:hypothetical protein